MTQPTQDDDSGKGGKKSGPKKNMQQDSGLKKIVRMIMRKNLQPAIIFSFSKKVSISLYIMRSALSARAVAYLVCVACAFVFVAVSPLRLFLSSWQGLCHVSYTCALKLHGLPEHSFVLVAVSTNICL